METGSATPLAVHPCRTRCDWHRCPTTLGGEPLCACRGCGAQWVPSQAWTPRNADGTISPEVLAIIKAWR